MTFYVMAPTFDRAWKNGVKPLMDNQITETEAFERITDPFRTFMLQQRARQGLRPVRRPRRANAASRPSTDETVDLRVLVPAFMISEIRRGFEIGFLIVLPFLVIDLIVATITMSMGMMMLPPTVDVAAVQDPVLRADRRLEPARRQPGALVHTRRVPSYSDGSRCNRIFADYTFG